MLRQPTTGERNLPLGYTFELLHRDPDGLRASGVARGNRGYEEPAAVT
jgi:hypothetical protein